MLNSVNLEFKADMTTFFLIFKVLIQQQTLQHQRNIFRVRCESSDVTQTGGGPASLKIGHVADGLVVGLGSISKIIENTHTHTHAPVRAGVFVIYAEFNVNEFRLAFWQHSVIIKEGSHYWSIDRVVYWYGVCVKSLIPNYC